MGIRRIQFKVVGTNPGASHLQRAEGFSVPGQFLIIIIGNLNFDAPDGGPHIRAHLGELLGGI